MANLLFDLDGTLLDSHQGILAGLRHTTQALGIATPSDAELCQLIGPPIQQGWAMLLGTHTQDPRVDEAVEVYRQFYNHTGKTLAEVYQGIPEALQALSQEHQLWVVTSKREMFASFMLDHFGLSPYFQGLYGVLPDKLDQPKAELIAKTMHNHQLQTHNTIMIGDRKYDLEGACHNNIPSVGVLWGFGDSAELQEYGASALCHQPLHLPDTVRTVLASYAL